MAHSVIYPGQEQRHNVLPEVITQNCEIAHCDLSLGANGVHCTVPLGRAEQGRAEHRFLMHGGCPPASITQSGLTTGKSVHGEPKSKARKRIYNK